tara:strand:- start:351 stop:1022 length:672 start_codon:yes stop_codon:yes gene_type:complete
MKIVITGASRGIGFESAKLFAASGHQVLAVSRNADKLSELAKYGVTPFSFDLTAEDYSDLIEKVKVFGEIDVLINNAGALVNKPFSEISNADLLHIYNVNVFTPFRLVRDLSHYFSSQSHTINISSIGGVQGSVKFPGLSAYSSSKGALTILTECLAEEFKETKHRFNALALGAVQTEMLEEAFPGYQAPLSAQEMAKYLVRFALEDGLYYNGKVLNVSSSTP